MSNSMLSNQNSQEFRKNRIPEGIIIAATPVIAYLLTFFYEQGFCSVFGIPLEFITPTFTTLFLVTFALIPILFVLFSLVNVIHLGMPKKIRGGPEYQRIMTLVVFGFIIWFGGLINKKYAWSLWMIFIVILFIELGLPLLTQRRHKGYHAKLEAQDKLDYEEGGLGKNVIEFIGREGALFLVLILILGLLANFLGGNNAINQKNFLVVNTSSPPVAVLRIYGDKLICAPFIKETKELQGSFFVLNLTTQPKLILTQEKIGPLRSGTK